MSQQYKCLIPLAMFYMSIKIVTVLLIYKLVIIGPINTTAATLIIPVWFLTGDILTEVYGYHITKKIIWSALVCQLIFAFICAYAIKLPSPNGWLYQGAYNQVLGSIPRLAFASSTAVVAGAFLNSYYVAKWKILLRGKVFWLRSLGATIIGEAVFTLLTFSMGFIGIASYKLIFQLIAISFLIKLLVNLILIMPISLLATFIKRIEGVEDHDLTFNHYSQDAIPIPIQLNQASNLP